MISEAKASHLEDLAQEKLRTATLVGRVPKVQEAAVYLYELRRGEQIIATGHLTYDQPLEIGQRLTIAGRQGIVRSIIPVRGQNQQRLIVQLLPTPDDP